MCVSLLCIDFNIHLDCVKDAHFSIFPLKLPYKKILVLENLVFCQFSVYRGLSATELFRDSNYLRETAIGYKKAKTNRNWVQILHFYHAKTVNTDMRRIHVPNTNLGRHERN